MMGLLSSKNVSLLYNSTILQLHLPSLSCFPKHEASFRPFLLPTPRSSLPTPRLKQSILSFFSSTNSLACFSSNNGFKDGNEETSKIVRGRTLSFYQHSSVYDSIAVVRVRDLRETVMMVALLLLLLLLVGGRGELQLV